MTRLFSNALKTNEADSYNIHYRYAEESDRNKRLRRFILLSFAFFAVVVFGVTRVVASTPQGWYSDFDAAANQSKKSNRPLYVVIAREGCSACAEQERTFRNPSVKRALSPAVKVRVESAYRPDLVSKYAAGGTPTTLVFASGNYSNPVYQYTGVMDSDYLVQVGRSLKKM